jgi:hypothetical protein
LLTGIALLSHHVPVHCWWVSQMAVLALAADEPAVNSPLLAVELLWLIQTAAQCLR